MVCKFGVTLYPSKEYEATKDNDGRYILSHPCGAGVLVLPKHVVQAGALRKPKLKTKCLITLTGNEIATLLSVLGHIGGPPEGARGYVDSVYKKLIATKTYTECDKPLAMKGVIHFEN